MRLIVSTIVGRVAALGAGGDAEAFFLWQVAGFHDHFDAGDIDGGRLFHEDVFAGFDRGLEVHRAEMGRRGKDNVVDLGNGEQLLVSVDAEELAFFGDVVANLFEIAMAIVHAVVEQVGQRDDLDIFVGDLRAFFDVFGVIGVLRIDDFRAGADGSPSVRRCRGRRSR